MDQVLNLFSRFNFYLLSGLDTLGVGDVVQGFDRGYSSIIFFSNIPKIVTLLNGVPYIFGFGLEVVFALVVTEWLTVFVAGSCGEVVSSGEDRIFSFARRGGFGF